MKREEALARGLEVQETQHSMKRRSPWHDYCRRGTYMLTLVVEGRRPLLGRLVTSGTAAVVEKTVLGRTIETEEIAKIHHYYPMVEVWKVCVMPDHIHIIVRVNEDMPDGKTLGVVVRGFKIGCSKAWWNLMDRPSVETEGTVAALTTEGTVATLTAEGTVAAVARVTTAVAAASVITGATVPSVSTEGRRLSLFEPGYNDKILLHEGQLDNWKAYLDDNPRRLMLKRQNPQLFTVLHDMVVAKRHCQVVGNRFLLDVPDKMAVIVHRCYTDEENARLREQWLACGERGGVLVSAAIAPKEKAVLREAMDCGYRIILLRENGFPELYKPSGESFDACSNGLLLQVSPWEFHMERKTITRFQCLELNDMAEVIVG